MEIIDLTQPLIAGFSAFPGDPAPAFNKDASLTRDGYRQQSIRMVSHSGTHIDAPSHMVSRGAFLDAFPASHFIGKALALRVQEPGPIQPTILMEQARDLAFDAEFILISAAWGRLWGKKAYYRGYPFLSPECCRWLASLSDPHLPKAPGSGIQQASTARCGKLRGIGLDTPSPDPVSSTAYPAHRALMDVGLLIMENIVSPDALLSKPQTADQPTGPAELFMLYALPLPLPNADGAPARIVAIKG